MRVDVWSDVLCPWCYIGKRRLEAALARFPHPVEVKWHAFELDPSAPRSQDAPRPAAERLARKYRISIAEAQAKLDQMTATAARDGLDFHFDRAQPGNSFDAHRLLHLAAARGVQDALKERLLRAYFTDGEAIADRETLVRLAADAGLDEEAARAVLFSDAYAAEVRADEELARTMEVTGVPFFVIDGKYAVAGAQSPDVLLEALERAASA